MNKTFAFADSFDERTKTYRGLKAGERIGSSSFSNNSLIVKPEFALRQLQEQEAKRQKPTVNAGATIGGGSNVFVEGETQTSEITSGGVSLPPVSPQLQRFHGTVELDATKLGRDAGQIGEVIVQHLAGLVGTKVKISLEIHAEIPEGVSEQVHRTVTENCRTLKFSDFGFENE